MHHLKRENRELIYSGAILDFYRDTMELPDGKTEEWDFIAHRKGGACVVPVFPDGKILMIHQYRPAIDRETLELPAGARDSAEEDTAVTAERELREETGYVSDPLIRLVSLRPAVAYCNEFTDIYLAENIRKAGAQELDEAEEITMEAFSREELLRRIFAGEIQDAKTVAGILAYAVRGQQKI